MLKSDFINKIISRGYFHQSTNIDELDNICKNNRISAYIGFDCTASSLHVGSLMQIMMLRILQKCGHRPIVLMGGGTSKIGDPSGKDNSRPLLTNEQINKNKNSLKEIFSKFLSFNTSDSGALMVDNAEWLDKLNMISFLRNFGKNFSVNRLLNMDSVKLRLEREQNLSFLEFNYAILQAYDFLELFKRENCILQMGGSDQWGNIITGVDLTRRIEGKEVFGLTSPLITSASGSKMGKTANGAIWLNKDMLDPWDFWQFWRNTEDKDTLSFLKLFTELPLEEINRLSKLKDSDINEAKIILATEVTKLCHGDIESQKAKKTAGEIFEKGDFSGNIPNYLINLNNSSEISLIDALIKVNFVKSKGEARRLIKGGGAKINNIKIEDENYLIKLNNLENNKKIIVSSGKKNHASLSFN